MKCRNCGKEFDGKFCVSCGNDYEERRNNPRNGAVRPNKALGVIAKVYRWLLAGGMIFVGIVSILCLTAPTLVESFLGETNPLCTGFKAIGGKDVDVPSSVVNASILLLVLSLIALVYGGVQLFFAIKRPYVGIKKYVTWGIDGVITIMLIVIGAIVASATKSEELMEAKLGSGFAMCIVMGVFGLVFLGARIFYEFKLFKWEDTGLSEEEIAKATEKKELSEEQLIRKMSLIWIVILLALIALITILYI